ncbi:MAG TPA: type VII secretion integral membrane protein EccD [Mycobacterium sp.]|nr:type VII secretion integral membrane protein EccD [Mycobacterium sp.]
MHHALAVPTQNDGSHPGGGGVRRLSIDAEAARVDLVLSAATPIGLLIPPIVDILTRSSGFRVGPLAVHYQLSLPGSNALNPSKTLAQLGIRDGAALLLTSSPTELMVPRFDDEAEAVSASVSVMESCWTRRWARLAGSLATMWLAGIAATVLTRAMFHGNDDHRAGCAGVAATIALLSLLAAAIAYRVAREQSIGLTWGTLATSFGALAGLLVVPGGPGAPNAVFAAAAAATCAAAMRAISNYAVAFTALLTFAATGTTAAMVATITAIPMQAIGAASTAISLAFVEASAPLSVTLARLSPSTADLTVDVQSCSPHLLNARAIRAHAWLTSLTAAFSASAALGAIGAALGSFPTGEPRFPGLLFATVTGGVLLLRARAHRDLARSVPLIICGIATVSTVLVATAAAYPQWTAHVAGASLMLGAVALYLTSIRDTTTVSPIGRRSVELLEYLALAVVVPLAVWLCGLYGATRSLNLL